MPRNRTKNAKDVKSSDSFDVFRYQLSIKSGFQFNLFGEEMTTQELKARKNNYFHDQLLNVKNFISAHGNTLLHKIMVDVNDITVFKIGPERKITLQDRDFERKTVETVADVTVVIDNRPDIQKIAINHNKQAFQSSFVVVNVLAENLNKLLDEFGIEITIAPILVKEDFWKLMKTYEHKITSLRFEIIKPNISNISSSLGDQFKELVDITNSMKTIVELKAPEGRVLENINEKNEPLMEIADYATKGGASDIKLKIKNVVKPVRINSTIEKVTLTDIEIVGNAKDVAKLYKQILGT
ncbi:MAG TPA: hypothetical protein VGN64_09435 [Dyadobacter sp.]|jgi:hypothetical protein|nr:hypothetical protein [Dyadobacter sp.]